ncbi:putative transcription regulator mTERF family [Rosa chinensis]|uniref:Putative transcription regulator mTERF family n=1 Tax=Rosa chinensis TaxID=74649 RepID=A0A2P6PWK8_ROSCH|nr:uncharacterized protein LOC112169826 isoform X1 [Rosa chinensis]PRQ26296.1 putative transcription regulator mTERF family [Rosa chinensis]
MALNYIFRKTLPSAFSRLFCRPRFPVEALQNQWFCTTRLTGSSSDDFTVSYLVNSCGLSPEAAIKASHKVKLQSLVKPDSVLALLREYEFSDSQISTVVRRYPRLVLADGKKTLLPKLAFFCSIGMSRLDLARTLSYNPILFTRSLKNCIIPCYTFLRSVVLSDFKVVNIWKRHSWIFGAILSKNVIPNIGLLRELGVPQSSITLLVTYHAEIVMRKPESFSELVGEVEQLGFDPQKSSFVHAMHALYGKKTTWRRNEEAYRRWGWSDNDILSAFRLCPLCMIKSEKKIMETMDFLVNKMGWKLGKLAKFPYVFLYSLEKRIIPRCSVVRVLLLKGLMKEDKLSLATIITTSEKYFLNMFVTRYLDRVPQLSNVYQGKAKYSLIL